MYARGLLLGLTSQKAVKAKFGIAPVLKAQERRRATKNSGRPAKRGKGEKRGPPLTL